MLADRKFELGAFDWEEFCNLCLGVGKKLHRQSHQISIQFNFLFIYEKGLSKHKPISSEKRQKSDCIIFYFHIHKQCWIKE
jgi:hypothetical protein